MGEYEQSRAAKRDSGTSCFKSMLYDVWSHRWLWPAPHFVPTGYQREEGSVVVANSGPSVSQRTSRPRWRQGSVTLGETETATERTALPLQMLGNPRRDI